MLDINVTPTLLVSIAAVILSIVFNWFPPAVNWYDTLTPGKKQQVMIAMILLAAVAIFGATCIGIFIGACDKTTISAFVQAALVAVGVNQGIHFLTKPDKSQADAGPANTPS